MDTTSGPQTALVLTGGGARAAYQVGALQAILAILDPNKSAHFRNPFPIVCGSSAGAINATAYACRAAHPHAALKRLEKIWRSLHTADVYRSDPMGVFGNGMRWLGMLMFGWALQGLRDNAPKSLLDNRPLAKLLCGSIDFPNLQRNLHTGHLHGLAITASSYTSGNHLTFYQSSGPLDAWEGRRRYAIAEPITIDHLMASSAIPFVFPAAHLALGEKGEWCGDGSMRQLAPISPAIHLGADRVLVISTNAHGDTPTEEDSVHQSDQYPTLAQIGGHALSDIFIDGLSIDLERISRINTLLESVPPSVQLNTGVKKIDVLTISPSKSIDEIALKHLNFMPKSVRAFLRVLGVSGRPEKESGGLLASFLLFESAFTGELIELAFNDVMARQEEIKAFFYGEVNE
ncbi:MAG TPA: Patatin [Advenella kashmirensis]|uniref:Patatin n=2 Tax=Advenella TaxID=290425 RepID=A0A356LEL4_9BURK|nr:Patatin [Advenella kashmirensis]